MVSIIWVMLYIYTCIHILMFVSLSCSISINMVFTEYPLNPSRSVTGDDSNGSNGMLAPHIAMENG